MGNSSAMLPVDTRYHDVGSAHRSLPTLYSTNLISLTPVCCRFMTNGGRLSQVYAGYVTVIIFSSTRAYDIVDDLLLA